MKKINPLYWYLIAWLLVVIIAFVLIKVFNLECPFGCWGNNPFAN